MSVPLGPDRNNSLRSEELYVFRRALIRYAVREEVKDWSSSNFEFEKLDRQGLILTVCRVLGRDCPFLPVEDEAFRQSLVQLIQLIMPCMADANIEILIERGVKSLLYALTDTPFSAELGSVFDDDNPCETLKYLLGQHESIEELPPPWSNFVEAVSTRVAKQLRDANKDRIRDIYRYTPFRLLSLASHVSSPPKMAEMMVRALVCTPFGMKSMLQRCARASFNKEMGLEKDKRAEKLLQFLGHETFKESAVTLASACLKPIRSVYSSISVSKVVMQTKRALERLCEASGQVANPNVSQTDQVYTKMARMGVQEVWKTLRTLTFKAEPSGQAALRWFVNSTASFHSNQLGPSLDEVANVKFSNLEPEHSDLLRRWLVDEVEFETSLRSLQDKKQALKNKLRRDRANKLCSGDAQDEDATLGKLQDLRERIHAMERPQARLDSLLQTEVFGGAKPAIVAALSAV